MGDGPEVLKVCIHKHLPLIVFGSLTMKHVKVNAKQKMRFEQREISFHHGLHH